MVKNDKLSQYQKLINYYRELVNNVESLEPEELLLIQSERDSIHGFIQQMKQEGVWSEHDAQPLKEVDYKLQLAARSVQFSSNPDKHEKQRWWWYLDKLNLLNEDEKSTL